MIQVNDGHRRCFSHLPVSCVCMCVGRRDCMRQTLCISVIRALSRPPANLIWLCVWKRDGGWWSMMLAHQDPQPTFVNSDILHSELHVRPPIFLFSATCTVVREEPIITALQQHQQTAAHWHRPQRFICVMNASFVFCSVLSSRNAATNCLIMSTCRRSPALIHGYTHCRHCNITLQL